MNLGNKKLCEDGGGILCHAGWHMCEEVVSDGPALECLDGVAGCCLPATCYCTTWPTWEMEYALVEYCQDSWRWEGAAQAEPTNAFNVTVISASMPVCSTNSGRYDEMFDDAGAVVYSVFVVVMTCLVCGSSLLVWLRPPGVWQWLGDEARQFFRRNSLQNFWPFWGKSLKERWGSVDGLRGWAGFFITWSNSYTWNETCEGCANPEELHAEGNVWTRNTSVGILFTDYLPDCGYHTLLFISGAVIAFTNAKRFHWAKSQSLSCKDLVQLSLQVLQLSLMRYLKFVTVLWTMWGFAAFLFPVIIPSPSVCTHPYYRHHTVDTQLEYTKDTALSVLLMYWNLSSWQIQNMPNNWILQDYWYLMVNVQLFPTAIFLVLLGVRYPLVGILATMCTAMLCLYGCANIAYEQRLVAGYFNQYTHQLAVDFYELYWVKPWTRGCPFFLGVAYGLTWRFASASSLVRQVAFVRNAYPYRTRIAAECLQFCCLSVMAVYPIMMAVHDDNKRDVEGGQRGNVDYIAWNPAVWSSVVGVLLSALALHDGTTINWFLRLSAPFSIASLAAFLVQMPVIQWLGFNNNKVNNCDVFGKLVVDLPIQLFWIALASILLIAVFEQPFTIILYRMISHAPQLWQRADKTTVAAEKRPRSLGFTATVFLTLLCIYWYIVWATIDRSATDVPGTILTLLFVPVIVLLFFFPAHHLDRGPRHLVCPQSLLVGARRVHRLHDIRDMFATRSARQLQWKGLALPGRKNPQRFRAKAEKPITSAEHGQSHGHGSKRVLVPGGDREQRRHQMEQAWTFAAHHVRSALLP